MSKKRKCHFDVHGLIEESGGPAAVREMMSDHVGEVKIKTIQKWRERNSMPSWALAAIMVYLRRKRRLGAISKYLLEVNDKN
jgi:hypothetical protein